MPQAPFTKSGDTIVNDFAAAAQSGSRTILDFTLGSILRAIGEAVAVVADWLQKLYLFALLVSRLQTSRGQWVDTFCVDFMPAVPGSATAALPKGSPRLPASAASGQITFSRSTPQAQAIVPVGTLVATFDGLQLFQVIADTTNTAYSATIIPGGGFVLAAGSSSLNVTVAALAAGANGNINAGTVTMLRSPLVGVDSVTNASAFANGFNAESDDALKLRFQLFILSLRAGTVDAIKYAVTSLQLGLQTAVHENILPDGSTAYGAVTVFIDDGSGTPPSTLVQIAAAAVNSIRAGGARPAVVGATKRAANPTMTIAVGPGYYKPTVVAAVANAVGAYIQALKLEQSLPYTMLEHIAYSASAGVTNVSGITLNGQSSDLVPFSGQTIKLGTSGVVVN